MIADIEPVQFVKTPTGSWNKLVEIAHDNLMPGEPHGEQHGAALAVWEAASSLRLEAFEKARYHGLGIVGCTFMRGVMTPKGRQNFIENAGATLAQDHNDHYGSWDRTGLLFNEIWQRSQHYVTGWPSHSGYDDIPLEERIVTNTLVISAPHDVPDPPRELIARVLVDDAAKENIRMGSLGVASFGLQLAINLYHRQRTGKPVMLADQKRLIDIVDPDTITSFDITETSRILARLHAEELTAMGDFAWLGSDHVLHIDKTRIPEHHTSTEHMPLSRERCAKPIGRIGCPLRHVRGAIAFASEVVGPTINEAQRLLLS